MKVIRKEILIGAGIVLAVLCVVTALLYFVLVNPRSLQLADINSKLAAKQADMDSLSADQMKTLLVQAEKRRAELSDYMVLSGQQGELSIRLRQLASASRLDGFSVKDSTTGGSTNSDAQFTSELRMRILFNGDFSGFAGFIYALETNKPVVFVDGFKVAHLQDDPTRINGDIDSCVLAEGKR
jgi:hypothetical protein